jgi:hypothetical protein
MDNQESKARMELPENKTRATEAEGVKTRRFEALKRRLTLRGALKIVVVALSLLLTIFQLPASFIERFYSNGFYARLQALLTPLTNYLPFAVYDLLIVAVVIGLPVWWTIRITKAEKGRRLRKAAKLLINTIVLTATLFLLFQLLWGFNYMREPLTEKLDYDAERINEEVAIGLYRLCIERLNAEVEEVHQTNLPDDEEWRRRIQPSYNVLLKEFGRTGDITLAKPKATLFDKYLEASGITGLLNPFGHETIVGRGYHSLDRAFILAHEWGHLAGFSDEAEASFVGLLALLRSEDGACRYAGWLALYAHLPLRSLKEKLKGENLETPNLSPQVENDLREMDEEAAKRRTNPTVSKAQWEMYDQFLKAQHATASYGELITLVMGTEIDESWKPSLRVVQ